MCEVGPQPFAGVSGCLRALTCTRAKFIQVFSQVFATPQTTAHSSSLDSLKFPWWSASSFPMVLFPSDTEAITLMVQKWQQVPLNLNFPGHFLSPAGKIEVCDICHPCHPDPKAWLLFIRGSVKLRE